MGKILTFSKFESVINSFVRDRLLLFEKKPIKKTMQVLRLNGCIFR